MVGSAPFVLAVKPNTNLVYVANLDKLISVVVLLLNMHTPYGSVCVETVLLPPLATYRLLLYESKVILHGPPPVTMPF